VCPDFPNGRRLSLELAEWARLYACRNPCAITPGEFLDVSRAILKLSILSFLFGDYPGATVHMGQ
jgi:hypothetical protein